MSKDNHTIEEELDLTPEKDPAPPEKGKKGLRLAIEIILTVIAIVAICFLPAVHLYLSNVEELEFSELTGSFLTGSVYMFIWIGLGLFAILRVIVRKRPYFAGCTAAVAVFLMVNFGYVRRLFASFITNYIAASIVSLLVVAILIAGVVFLFLHLCKKEFNGRAIMIVLCAVFVGLLIFNGVSYLVTREADVEEDLDDPETTQVAETDPEETEEPEETDDPDDIVVEPDPTEEPEETEIPGEDPGDEIPLETPAPATEEPVVTPTPEPTEEPRKKTKTPNIYLIVLDEYASMGAMEKYYSYNCEPLRAFMRTAGINWSEHSYSMTNETKYCMTDLNMMDYVSYHRGTKRLKEYRTNSEIKKVFQKKLGYKLYQFSSSNTWFNKVASLRDSKTMKSFKTTFDGVESDQIIKQESIFGTFDDLIGALTPQDKIGGNSESLKKYGFYSSDEIRKSKGYKDSELNYLANVFLNAFDFWENGKNFQSSEKRMILSYLKIPHVPFLFDEYGQIISHKSRMNWQDPKIYLGQYLYVTKHLEVIFKTLITNDPECIIIVTSDHGVRSHEQGFAKITAKDNCWVFLAMYNQGDPLDIEGMSPINLMRLIATKLGVKKDPVKDYVTVDSASDLSDVKYPKR